MSDEVPAEESHETDGQENVSEEASENIEEGQENVDAENVAISAEGTELQMMDESKKVSADNAAEGDKTEPEHEDETGEEEEEASEQPSEEPDADEDSANVDESKEAEDTTARDSESSQKEKRKQSLDEFEKDMDKKADVVITKSVGADSEVLEENRSGYLWEGPCSSSSSSDERKSDQEKKKKDKIHAEGEEKGEEEDEEEGEEEEEEEELLPVAEVKIFPREEYMKRYASLISERAMLQKKNVILQKKLYDYCKKRKLEVYFEDIANPDPKLETKYTRQLNLFHDFLQLDKQTRIALKEGLERLQVEQADAEVTFARDVEELLQTEREVGTGLISANNGKPITDKALENLLKKQRKAILELHEIRLKYIRLRDSLAAKEADLRKLETFGEGLHLLDYEQLRLENQSYSDKIEERDEELTHLRSNATSSIQTLAHIREKANATALNIDDLYDELEFMETEANRVREYTGDLKKQRDDLRAELAKVRREAGLLVHQRLIKDFERRIEESQALAVEIENLKNNYYDQNKRLSTVQETIKVHKSFKESLRGSTKYDFSYLLAHKPSRQGRDSLKLKDLSITSDDDGTGSVDEIKKGTPFYPREKYSRIIKYVSDIKTMDTKHDDEDETHSNFFMRKT